MSSCNERRQHVPDSRYSGRQRPGRDQLVSKSERGIEEKEQADGDGGDDGGGGPTAPTPASWAKSP